MSPLRHCQSACIYRAVRSQISGQKAMAEKAPPRPRGKLQNACSRTGTSGRESVAGKDLHKHDKPPPPGDEVQLAQGGGGREKDKEVELERLAMAEILQETKRGKVRAEQIGAMGWQKCSLPKANKRFLNSVVASNVTNNKRMKLDIDTRSKQARSDGSKQARSDGSKQARSDGEKCRK